MHSVIGRAAAPRDRDDQTVRDLGDLSDLFPDVRGHVAEAVIGVRISGLWCRRLQEDLRAPTSRIHYAGDATVYRGLGIDSSATTVSTQRRGCPSCSPSQPTIRSQPVRE